LSSRRIEPENPRKILVRTTNWIGDAVISLPALEALRARFPTSEIVLVSKPWVSEIYCHYPGMLRQIIYDPDGKHRGLSGLRRLIADLRAEHFDLAVLFQNAFQAAWMAWRARIPARIGYARDGRGPLLTESVQVPPRGAYGHEAYYYLQLLFRSGLIERPEPVKPLEDARLALGEAELSWAAKRLQTLRLDGSRFLMGIHPGASFGPAKRWPPERFAAFADRMIGALRANVLIFGSAAEAPLAESIARAMKHAPTLLAGKTTLTQMLALFAHCQFVMTNDSGPMHLAAAMGLPLVAVFGSTDERATGPLSLHARVVKHPVACSPCGLRNCPIDFRCMQNVTVEDVSNAALELVARPGITHEHSA
jgi:lipopolysaccharide heptosyltransferase II